MHNENPSVAMGEPAWTNQIKVANSSLEENLAIGDSNCLEENLAISDSNCSSTTDKFIAE